MKNGVIAFILDIIFFLGTLLGALCFIYPAVTLVKSWVNGEPDTGGSFLLFMILLVLLSVSVIFTSVLNIILSSIIARRGCCVLRVFARIFKYVAIATLALMLIEATFFGVQIVISL